jgi:hypothetical protein
MHYIFLDLIKVADRHEAIAVRDARGPPGPPIAETDLFSAACGAVLLATAP